MRISATAEQAEDALVMLAGHLPVDVPIGRPWLATGTGDGGVEFGSAVDDEENVVWWAWPDRAERLVPLADGRAELTRWRAGVEVYREIGRVH